MDPEIDGPTARESPRMLEFRRWITKEWFQNPGVRKYGITPLPRGRDYPTKMWKDVVTVWQSGVGDLGGATCTCSKLTPLHTNVCRRKMRNHHENFAKYWDKVGFEEHQKPPEFSIGKEGMILPLDDALDFMAMCKRSSGIPRYQPFGVKREVEAEFMPIKTPVVEVWSKGKARQEAMQRCRNIDPYNREQCKQEGVDVYITTSTKTNGDYPYGCMWVENKGCVEVES